MMPNIERERQNGPAFLVFGRGLVGQSFSELSANTRIFSHQEVDILDKDAVRKAVAEFPGKTVINCAAYTAVDKAEIERDKALKTNVEGAVNIGLACREEGKQMVQLSTDFVFPGTEERPGPYGEYDRVFLDPDLLGYYGLTKGMAEEELAKVGGLLAIVRLAFPAKRDAGFLIKTKSLIEKGIGLFDKQVITPTLVDDLYLAIREISGQNLTGIFHVASPETTTPYDYGVYLAAQLRLPQEVKRSSFEEYSARPGVAKRPKIGGLMVADTQKTLNLNFRPWRAQIDYLLC